ncbi:MAG TPA: DUF427 domain-containing protein, partial [Vicinamibacteria bacterium]
RRVRVTVAGVTVADSFRTLRVLETSHPPSYYIPPEDVRTELLVARPERSVCEWKGAASYWSLHVAERVAASCAWSYPDPPLAYAGLRGCLAFYPGRVDACFVDAERVAPQDGGFYGGWITSDLVGPFKGGPGTSGW